MKIEYLADHVNYADTAAKWIYDEFIKGIQANISYQDVLKRYQTGKKTELPVRFIALVDGQCAGTISLVKNDLKCREIYTPWLASLYVDKPFRSKKVAAQLIGRIKETAKDLGYSELYLRTENTGGYYKERGWLFVEHCTDEYEVVADVFKMNL